MNGDNYEDNSIINENFRNIEYDLENVFLVNKSWLIIYLR